MINFEKAKELMKQAIDESNTKSDIIEHFVELVYFCGYEEGLNALETSHKKGKWILVASSLESDVYKCSECGRTVKDYTGYKLSFYYPFCHCGADMREEAQG